MWVWDLCEALCVLNFCTVWNKSFAGIDEDDKTVGTRV